MPLRGDQNLIFTSVPLILLQSFEISIPLGPFGTLRSSVYFHTITVHKRWIRKMAILLHATALHFNNIELLMLDEKTGILLRASELYLNNNEL